MTPLAPDTRLPDLPLREGQVGAPIRDLQQRLVAATSQPINDPLGSFGHATTTALRAFQHQAGVDVDGICGKQTWSALVEAGFTLGDRPLYRRSPMLRGDDVTHLQLQLSELGFQRGRVDGIFGPETADAVALFQRNAGLVADGVVGPSVLEQLKRLSGMTGRVTKAHLSEQLTLLDAPRHLAGRRVVIAESGSLPAIANALGRQLDEAGAHSLVVHHPEGSAQAEEANRFDAHAFVSLSPRTDSGCRLASYRSPGFESMGGRRLAEFASTELLRIEYPGVIEREGMRINVLRETRMPAMCCEIGPVTWIVEHSAELADALATAVSRWAVEPADEPE